MIIKPSLDDGAKEVFQSTLVGEPGLNPMELLPNIPDDVRIGAIWGSEDVATRPDVPIAEFLKAQTDDRYHWKLIKGGHVLYDDCPEEVTTDMVTTLKKWNF